MNRNQDSFSVKFSQFMGYGLSFMVLIMFLRSFFPFATAYAPIMIGASTIYLLSIAKITNPTFRLSFPKPTKSDIMPFVPVLFITVFELAYFQVYPIFPQYQSTDFSQHVKVASDYARSAAPMLSSQVLYYGVEYLLSLCLLLGGLPLVTTRYGMGVLVALSPMCFYLVAFKLSGNHRIAWITSLVYALTGSWFAMVFVSGLYPNFYGVLASLFLIAASRDFIARRVGVSGLFLFSLALLNAFLSHYTTVIVMPLLAVYLLMVGRKEKVIKRSLIVALALLAPLVLGFVAFNSLASYLLGSLTGDANFRGGTWLSEQIPIPSVSYLVAEVNNDWLTAFLMFPALAIFIALAIRKPSWDKLLLVAWLLLTLGVVAFSPISWRFSFVALIPLVLMVGYVLGYKVKDLPRDWSRRSMWAPALLIIFLFLIPSPALGAFQGDQARIQASDYAAMAWLAQRDKAAEVALVLTDWHFIYSQDLDGPAVAYAPNAHVLWYDPTNAYFSALNHSATWMIWTKSIEGVPGYGIFIPDCQKPFDLTLTANTTQTQTNRTVSFEMASSPKLDLQGYLAVGNNTVPIGLGNGTGRIELSFNEEGNYTIFAQFRNVVTDSFILNIGDSISYQRVSVSVPDDFCLPWKSFNNLSLPGGHLVYQNDNVKIWQIRVMPEPQFETTPKTVPKWFVSPIWHLANLGLRENTFAFAIYDSNNSTFINPPNIRTMIAELKPQTIISSAGLGSLTRSDCHERFPCFSGWANFLDRCQVGQTYEVKVDVSYSQSFANSTMLSGIVACSP